MKVFRNAVSRQLNKKANFINIKTITPSIKNKIKPFSTNNHNSQSGYQSIGSFHSENIEHLVSLPNDKYKPPCLPFKPLISSSITVDHRNTNINYSNDFLLDRSKWTFLNHGAFGAALQCANVRANQWRDFLEEQPLRYFDRELLPHLAYSNRQLAQFVNGDPKAMALIQNVTSGMNTIISGYCREINKKILYFDVAYGSVKKMLHIYSDITNLVEISIDFPIQKLESSDFNDSGNLQFYDSLEETISNLKSSGYDLKDSLLVLDHITSNTAITLPIQSLAKRAKEEGMMVVVDGAHGTLTQNLNMKELVKSGVTFYVSNCHKWLSAPRGIGFLYCEDSHLRESILRQPAIVSHGIDDGYLSRFLWDGCRDYSAALSLPIVLEYWNYPHIVREKMNATLHEAVRLLAAIWHTNSTTLPESDENWNMSLDDNEEYLFKQNITIVPLSMHSSMALVRLPDRLSGNHDTDLKTSTDAKIIQDYLYDNFIEVPIKCIGGVLYVRVSCHVYNTLDEYKNLGLAIKKLALKKTMQ